MVDTRTLGRLLCSLGMIPHDDDSLLSVMTSRSWFSVLLDGRVVGQVPADLAESFVSTLRRLKVTASEGVSLYSVFRKIYTNSSRQLCEQRPIVWYLTILRLIPQLSRVNKTGFFASVHLSTRSLSDLNDIWCVGRVLLPIAMSCDPVQGQGQSRGLVFRPRSSSIFKMCLLHHLQWKLAGLDF